MKITKAQLKQIIKEETEQISELLGVLDGPGAQRGPEITINLVQSEADALLKAMERSDMMENEDYGPILGYLYNQILDAGLKTFRREKGGDV